MIACTWIAICNFECDFPGEEDTECWYDKESIEITREKSMATTRYTNVMYLTTAMFMGGENISPSR